jgi:CheY-like chemotaxis protein
MKTVLLTDDNEDIVELVKLVLANSGYRLETAPDGAQAVARCLTDPPPDLVLMDLNMPTLDGFEATRKLRAGGFGNPIVILTASESDADRKRAKECGSDAYILKTLNMDDVEKVIDRFLVDAGGID